MFYLCLVDINQSTFICTQFFLPKKFTMFKEIINAKVGVLAAWNNHRDLASVYITVALFVLFELNQQLSRISLLQKLFLGP